MADSLRSTRRSFLRNSALAGVGAYLGSGLRAKSSFASTFASANEQPVIGFIGTGIRYHTYHGKEALKFGPCAGIADVDFVQLGRAVQAAVDIHREKKAPAGDRGPTKTIELFSTARMWM